MSIIEAVILGLIQGLTEFLPISSSGHLTLGEMVMGIKTTDNVALDVALHIATLLSIVVFFMRGWWERIRTNPKLVIYAGVAGIPAIIFYLAGAEVFIDAAKNSPPILGFMFIGGGIFLVFATKNSTEEKHHINEEDQKNNSPDDTAEFEMKFPHVLWQLMGIGLAQATALMPGISRSGMTISASLIAKRTRNFAFEFSFLCGAPLMAGAALMKARKISEAASASLTPFIVGGIVAFISGLVALVLLRKVVIGGKFWLFGIYTIVLGAFLLVRSIWS